MQQFSLISWIYEVSTWNGALLLMILYKSGGQKFSFLSLNGGSSRGDLWGCGQALVGGGTRRARVLRTPQRSQSWFPLPVSYRQFIFGFEGQRHKAVGVGHQDDPQGTWRKHVTKEESLFLLNPLQVNLWGSNGCRVSVCCQTLCLLRVISCFYFKPCNLA